MANARGTPKEMTNLPLIKRNLVSPEILNLTWNRLRKAQSG
jgi:hypothetical protein